MVGLLGKTAFQQTFVEHEFYIALSQPLRRSVQQFTHLLERKEASFAQGQQCIPNLPSVRFSSAPNGSCYGQHPLTPTGIIVGSR